LVAPDIWPTPTEAAPERGPESASDDLYQNVNASGAYKFIAFALRARVTV